MENNIFFLFFYVGLCYNMGMFEGMYMKREEKDIWDQVIEYLPLIEKMANIYSSKNSLLEYEDLYQEACMVVYNKISSYDPSRGATLESYLISQIRYRFFDLFNMNKFVVYVPLIYAREAYKLSRIQGKSKIEIGKYLSAEEIKSQVNLSQDTIEILELANRTMYRSMTTSISDFIEIPVDDMPEDDVDIDMIIRERNCESSMISDTNIEDEFVFSSLREDMYERLDNLNKKQQESILYHLGFITGQVELFRDIAERVGGSKQNAHKHYCKGIKQLQKVMLEDWN